MKCKRAFFEGENLVFQFDGNLVGGDQEGKYDLDQVMQIHKIIEDGVANIGIDLGSTEFVNSSGLGMIIGLLTKSKKFGGNLVLYNPAEKMESLLNVTKLITVFKHKQVDKNLIKSFRIDLNNLISIKTHYKEYISKNGSLFTEDEDPPQKLIITIKELSALLIDHLKKHPNALYQLKPRQFEELIAEILIQYGWEVHLTPATKDGGYDLFAISTDISGVKTSWIIECKKYAAGRKVGVDIVRSLFGVKLDLKIAGALLATTSHFTKGVYDYKASRYDLELKDYEGIIDWINSYKPNPNGKLYLKENRLILPR